MPNAKLISAHGKEILLPHRRIDVVAFQARSLNTGDMTPGALVINPEDATTANPDGVLADASTVAATITASLAGKLHSTCATRLADTQYYLSTDAEIKQVVQASHGERWRWIPERFDCDDFAYVLKAFFSSIAYKTDKLSCGLCAGIIWGRFRWLDEFHACNWYLNPQQEFKLIEPQNGTVYSANDCLGDVTFVAA